MRVEGLVAPNRVTTFSRRGRRSECARRLCVLFGSCMQGSSHSAKELPLALVGGRNLGGFGRGRPRAAAFRPRGAEFFVACCAAPCRARLQARPQRAQSGPSGMCGEGDWRCCASCRPCAPRRSRPPGGGDLGSARRPLRFDQQRGDPAQLWWSFWLAANSRPAARFADADGRCTRTRKVSCTPRRSPLTLLRKLLFNGRRGHDGSEGWPNGAIPRRADIQGDRAVVSWHPYGCGYGIHTVHSSG